MATHRPLSAEELEKELKLEASVSHVQTDKEEEEDDSEKKQESNPRPEGISNVWKRVPGRQRRKMLAVPPRIPHRVPRLPTQPVPTTPPSYFTGKTDEQILQKVEQYNLSYKGPHEITHVEIDAFLEYRKCIFKHKKNFLYVKIRNLALHNQNNEHIEQLFIKTTKKFPGEWEVFEKRVRVSIGDCYVAVMDKPDDDSKKMELGTILENWRTAMNVLYKLDAVCHVHLD